ncbi:MAG: hypothetical protein IH610_05310 [Deltaproteobacteria bacterium]|nr:hypothetical protein [Deltaproteobacteria bacterium]
MRDPAYFVAVFGKPEPPEKDTVDSGRYPLGIRGTDTPGERGDVLLLYCKDSHGGNSNIVKGIGVVLTKNREAIYYRYLPFSSPLSRDQIEKTFTDDDREKLLRIASNSYWLFEISGESFRNATRGVVISWP